MIIRKSQQQPNSVAMDLRNFSFRTPGNCYYKRQGVHQKRPRDLAVKKDQPILVFLSKKYKRYCTLCFYLRRHKRVVVIYYINNKDDDEASYKGTKS